ncbi:MAG TPA: UDP-2,3-diacylglucosamine diphosphatase LpxI [Xanthobacteraceae bacterium]|nr:UDP-2,3-diacylglucosamine diphosphatase LpxI [Xanthobacteraceae bacterium]
MSDAQGPLAIVAGGGSIPIAVAEAVMRRGRRVVLFPVRGWADPAAVERFPHHWVAVGQGGRLARYARAEGCRDMVLVGTALRPALTSLRLDWTTLRLLPEIWRAFRGGDDHLLSGVARIFHDLGFRVVGAHEVAPEILMPRGNIGTFGPGQRDLADIARGLALLRAIGPFDVGQAVVVADNQVLAVEAVDGTDNMLARIAELRERGRVATGKGVGVLIKAPKPTQDRRLDMPAIGPKTVEAAARAGLAGIAVVAESTIVAEPAELARAADAAKLFVCGVGAP